MDRKCHPLAHGLLSATLGIVAPIALVAWLLLGHG